MAVPVPTPVPVTIPVPARRHVHPRYRARQSLRAWREPARPQHRPPPGGVVVPGGVTWCGIGATEFLKAPCLPRAVLHVGVGRGLLGCGGSEPFRGGWGAPTLPGAVAPGSGDQLVHHVPAVGTEASRPLAGAGGGGGAASWGTLSGANGI